ncbi:hypothetical protein D3C80_1663610 [compost metagenome]
MQTQTRQCGYLLRQPFCLRHAAATAAPAGDAQFHQHIQRLPALAEKCREGLRIAQAVDTAKETASGVLRLEFGDQLHIGLADQLVCHQHPRHAGFHGHFGLPGGADANCPGTLRYLTLEDPRRHGGFTVRG